MKKWKIYLRISPLVLILVLFLVGATAVLYNLQITHGEENQVQTEKRLARTVVLPASRGELLDRYGRPLVTNNRIYALRIDLNRLLTGSDDPNDVIDRLTCLMMEQGVPYGDNFPVLHSPYRYKAFMTEQERTYLDQFISKLGWPEDLTAEQLMVMLKETFVISDEYSEESARRIAAVRYELELRKVFLNGEPIYYIPDYQFARDVDISLVAMVREQDFPGVIVDTIPVREYRTQFAAHLLGRVGRIPEGQAEFYKGKGYPADALVGLDGLENGLEDWLRGKAGWQEEETNVSGKVTGILNTQQPEPGNNCFLTIDISLQEQVERALEAGVLGLRENGRRAGLDEKKQAGGGAVVLMSVKTGEILAMASYPTFDLTRFADVYAELKDDPMTPMVNRAIAGAYEPGSTFKMATLMAALESGTITPSGTVYDQVKYMYYAPSYTPSCTGSHGRVNSTVALQKSCNYYFFEVSRLTGIAAMNDYARQLGFGAKTGIELPGEREGILAGRDYCEDTGKAWYDGDVLQAAIGQSYNQFTPIQLCSYVATLANGGVRCKPHLLGTVKSYDYSETIRGERTETAATLQLKEDTLDAILTGMRMVCQEGGTAARIFANYRYPVAGKTGTAQIRTDGTPDNGVFVAFAPYDDPEVAVSVVVERGSAGSNVAPIALEVFDAYFRIQEEMNKRMPENQLHG